MNPRILLSAAASAYFFVIAALSPVVRALTTTSYTTTSTWSTGITVTVNNASSCPDFTWIEIILLVAFFAAILGASKSAWSKVRGGTT